MHHACPVIMLACGLVACAQPPPAALTAAPCAVAPRIDGRIAQGEWPAPAFDATWAMASTAGPVAARPATVWAMNSSVNLYLALRIADPDRELDLGRSLADVALVAFCRGAALAAGDDRKVTLPGIYADKHRLANGQDADDARRDGQAVMRWDAADGGQYIVEWRIPLGTDDPEDLAARPGERVRMNIVFADGFRPGGEGTEVGGLWTASADDANGWGELQLAADVGPEAPAPVPPAIAALLPHTDAPDRLAHRLRRVEVQDLDVDGRAGAAVTVEFVYPTLAGESETAQANLFLPPEALEPGARVPLLHNAGYEIDAAAAMTYLREGYLVSTPHAHPQNPLVRGPNLDNALRHAVSALPCVDRRLVSIAGGSAGGWTTLMMAAEAFPLCGAMPAVPPIDWGYNGAYIDSMGTTGPPADDPAERPMPILAVVWPIGTGSREVCGLPFDAPIYLALSPGAQLDCVTAPVQAYFSTADMLVPVDQVSGEWVRPHDAARFPAGFTTDPARCLPGRPARRLLDGLAAADVEVFTPDLPEARLRMLPDGTAEPGAPPPVPMPFSREKTWSVVILDEGAVEPQVGHFKYAWAIDQGEFRRWVRELGPQPEQLTAAKLRRLMMRAAGRPWLEASIAVGGAERPATLLDWPEAERADVLASLRAFASAADCAAKLAGLYAELPAELTVFGPTWPPGD